MILTVAAFLMGCDGKQQTIVKAYNSVGSSERAYVALVQAAIQAESLQGLKDANNTYLLNVRSIDTSDCPDDFITAMKTLESSLNEIDMYLSGINNMIDVDLTKFKSLQDARMSATQNLTSVAESHGLTITH